MANYPFVSVIIPTYGRPGYLEGALCSLMDQDYPREWFEIIVVDNLCMENTDLALRLIGRRMSGEMNLKYIREPRRGLVFARHTGAVHSQGELLLFTDDDAVFDKNWISAIVDVYARYPEVGAVGTRMEVKWDHDPAPWVRAYEEEYLGKLDYGNQQVVRRGLEIYGGSFSIRKEVLLKVGGFNPGQRGAYIAGDSEVGLCRKLGNESILVGWTPEATMWHLQEAATNGSLHDLKRRLRNGGICDAYLATFYSWPLGCVLRDILRKTNSLLRRNLELIRSRDRQRLRTRVLLEKQRYFYYLKYLWLYRFSKAIREEVMRRDWEFTNKYKAPPVEFCIRRQNSLFEDKG